MKSAGFKLSFFFFLVSLLTPSASAQEATVPPKHWGSKVERKLVGTYKEVFKLNPNVDMTAAPKTVKDYVAAEEPYDCQGYGDIFQLLPGGKGYAFSTWPGTSISTSEANNFRWFVVGKTLEINNMEGGKDDWSKFSMGGSQMISSVGYGDIVLTRAPKLAKFRYSQRAPDPKHWGSPTERRLVGVYEEQYVVRESVLAWQPQPIKDWTSDLKKGLAAGTTFWLRLSQNGVGSSYEKAPGYADTTYGTIKWFVIGDYVYMTDIQKKGGREELSVARYIRENT